MTYLYCKSQQSSLRHEKLHFLLNAISWVKAINAKTGATYVFFTVVHLLSTTWLNQRKIGWTIPLETIILHSSHALVLQCPDLPDSRWNAGQRLHISLYWHSKHSIGCSNLSANCTVFSHAVLNPSFKGWPVGVYKETHGHISPFQLIQKSVLPAAHVNP